MDFHRIACQISLGIYFFKGIVDEAIRWHKAV